MQGKLTVLVVDDDASVCDFVAVVLRDEGYNVHCVSNADQASEVLRNRELNVALVLTDIEMPGRSGIDLLRECKARHPGLPVVLMSGNAVRWLKEMGDAPFISKPISVRAFRKVVKDQIDLAFPGEKYETGTP